MKVISTIRRMNAEGTGAVEPAEEAIVEGDADTYEDARDIAAAKVPEGWQVLGWFVDRTPTGTPPAP